MVIIKNLIFLAASAAALVLPRDPAAVLADLKKIDSDTQSLTSAVNNWDGQLFNALPIESAESTLDNDIKSATSDANDSQVASETDAQTIITFINNNLEPDVKATIKALEAKKSQFQSAGLYNTVKSDIATLKTDTDSLGNALVAKAPSDRQNDAKAALAKIDADFAEAQAAFS